MKISSLLVLLPVVALTGCASWYGSNDVKDTAKSVTVEMYSTANPTEEIGTITLQNTPNGVVAKPNITSNKFLTPGLHGLHLHINGSCAEGGKAAGGHYDPAHTNVHLGPYAKGHLGDLPPLYANSNGSVVYPVLAPRLTLKDMLGRSLVIHAGGDNYSDNPLPLGGGGARVACGVISSHN